MEFRNNPGWFWSVGEVGLELINVIKGVLKGYYPFDNTGKVLVCGFPLKGVQKGLLINLTC